MNVVAGVEFRRGVNPLRSGHTEDTDKRPAVFYTYIWVKVEGS